MTGVTLVRRKYGDLEKFAADVQVKMGNRILSILAAEFSEYVKRSKLSGQVLAVGSGKTRASMGFYKLKRSKGPTFVVRPGRGIDGRLNYLGGMSKGMLITPKTGEWVYIRNEAGEITARVKAATVHARPIMVPAWQEYKSNVRAISRAVYGAYLDKAFSGAPVEVTE